MTQGKRRDEALKNLRWNWGEAYEISEGSGVWRAVRRDTGLGGLVAQSAEELLDQIVADYAAHPVPRT